MRIIQAPSNYEIDGYTVFMAGGMGDTFWHNVFFEELKDLPINILYPYNPNISDIVQQIKWEFDGLHNYINSKKFIFSCYFDYFTNQPVTMLELGKMLVLSQRKVLKNSFFAHQIVINEGFPCVVSFHKDAKLKHDIEIQCNLMNVIAKERTPKEHAQAVIKAYERLLCQ